MHSRHMVKLQAYRRTLPENEFAALEAWLSTFYPFQLDWLLELARFAVCNKSRQIGMSHSTAAMAVLWGAFHGELTTVISIGEREAKEVLSYARKHRAVLSELGSKMAARGGSDSALEIGFASGGRVLALPSTGGRSFSGNVFLDEFAYQERASEVWDAAIAVTLHGYRARVASTPNGVGNDFEQLWSDPRKHAGWAMHEVPLQRALDDGMAVNVDDCWKMAKGDSRLFSQLFECKFLDGELQYIQTDAINDCAVDGEFPEEGECYAGLDVGKTSDRTELVIVRRLKSGVRNVVHTEGCKRTDTSDLHRLATLAFGAKYNARRLAIDATGMGIFPAEQLQKKFGEHRVEAFAFTQQSKEILATELYSAFVNQTVRYKRLNKQLVNDLCSIRRIITSAGNVRYDAPHTDAGHADSAWALGLALHASSQPIPARGVGTTPLGMM